MINVATIVPPPDDVAFLLSYLKLERLARFCTTNHAALCLKVIKIRIAAAETIISGYEIVSNPCVL